MAQGLIASLTLRLTASRRQDAEFLVTRFEHVSDTSPEMLVPMGSGSLGEGIEFSARMQVTMGDGPSAGRRNRWIHCQFTDMSRANIGSGCEVTHRQATRDAHTWTDMNLRPYTVVRFGVYGALLLAVVSVWLGQRAGASLDFTLFCAVFVFVISPARRSGPM